MHHILHNFSPVYNPEVWREVLVSIRSSVSYVKTSFEAKFREIKSTFLAELHDFDPWDFKNPTFYINCFLSLIDLMMFSMQYFISSRYKQ